MPSGHGLSEQLCQGERTTDYSLTHRAMHLFISSTIHNEPAMCVYTKWKTRLKKGGKMKTAEINMGDSHKRVNNGHTSFQIQKIRSIFYHPQQQVTLFWTEIILILNNNNKNDIFFKL